MKYEPVRVDGGRDSQNFKGDDESEDTLLDGKWREGPFGGGGREL